MKSRTVKLFLRSGKLLKELEIPQNLAETPTIIFYGDKAFHSLLEAQGRYTECNCWQAPEETAEVPRKVEAASLQVEAELAQLPLPTRASAPPSSERSPDKLRRRKPRRVQPPPQICERDDCERKGQKIRHQTTRTRMMGVKGHPQRTVAIHVFYCEAYGSRRFLHSQMVGPHGERLEKLPGFAHYRFQDAVTGEVIETERWRGNWKLSKQGRKRIKERLRKFWANDDNRAQARARMSLRAASMWKDPDVRPKLIAAAQRMRLAKTDQLTPAERRLRATRAAQARWTKVLGKAA